MRRRCRWVGTTAGCWASSVGTGTSDRLPARPQAGLQPRYSIISADTVDSVRELMDVRPSIGQLRARLARVVKRLR